MKRSSHMTGPEHYTTAEVLLNNLRDEMAESPGTPLRTKEQQAQMIAEAQVHATLALASATAHAVESRGPGDIAAEWREVIWC